MSRFRFLAVLWLPVLAVSAWAQSYQIQPVPLTTYNDPNGGFMLGFRMSGKATVRFLGIGNIPSIRDVDDHNAITYRGYDDGYVGVDTGSNSSGYALPVRYTTNNWGYENQSQAEVVDGAIAFHAYSMANDGSTIVTDSSASPMWDLEVSQRLGRFGGRISGGASRVVWGAMLGMGFSSVNAKARGPATARLFSATDIYSLDGAVAPGAPYSAPSSQAIVRTDENGNTVTDEVDTTTYLANLPFSRYVEDLGSVDIEGFWQVKGSYFTLRTGPWLRYNFSPRFSLRASAGVSFTYIGLEMRYDEWLEREDLLSPIRTSAKSDIEKTTLTGVFAGLDAELWLTRNTGFFASLTYDDVSHQTVMTPDADLAESQRHIAEVDIKSGVGARFGLTFRF